MINYFENCETLDEAKKLYRDLAVKLHPDKPGGDTAKFQEMLNQFHNFKPGKEKFKGEFDKWDGQKYTEIVNQLLFIPGIQITICGSWIWLTGDTKPVKEQIKAIDTGDFMRRGFSKSKSQWYFSPKSYRKFTREEYSFDEIKKAYGAEEVETDKGRFIAA